jgi:hypothetical protein
MSKEKITPEVTAPADAKSTSLAAIAVDPAPPAVLLFGRYLNLLKGDPAKVWTFTNLELIRCQPGAIF